MAEKKYLAFLKSFLPCWHHVCLHSILRYILILPHSHLYLGIRCLFFFNITNQKFSIHLACSVPRTGLELSHVRLKHEAAWILTIYGFYSLLLRCSYIRLMWHVARVGAIRYPHKEAQKCRIKRMRPHVMALAWFSSIVFFMCASKSDPKRPPQNVHLVAPFPFFWSARQAIPSVLSVVMFPTVFLPPFCVRPSGSNNYEPIPRTSPFCSEHLLLHFVD
jgi:hypothetical protein